MFAATRDFLNRRVQNWARRRQGPDASTVTLSRRRVYILPTRQGLLYGFTLLVMLLGSMNYSSSLGFMLTFLLGGLGLVTMHACHANLTGLSLAAGRAPPVFAGDTAYFHLQAHNPGRSPRTALTLAAETGTSTVTGDLEAGERGTVRVPLPAEKRGWLPLGRLAVETTYPLGLFRAWSWLHMDLRLLVYPKPAEHAPPLPRPPVGQGGGKPQVEGEEDFSGLRTYRSGDSPHRIAWKASAREQALLVKQFTGGGESECWLDWEMLPGVSIEERLSVLCRWVLMAEEAGLSYGLKLPGRTLPPAASAAHRQHCLESLALFGERTT